MSSEPPAPLPSPVAAAPRKLSGLAVTAFVLSLLFFIPLSPLLGAMLGIVALVRHRPDRRGRGLAIAAIPIGLVLCVFVQVFMAAVAIPAFLRFQQGAKAAECNLLLGQLRSAAEGAALDQRVDASGQVMPPAFPRARTGWVPLLPCCRHPSKPRCTSGDAEWHRQPWRALEFSVPSPHHAQVRYSSDGQAVTLETRADVDCDGDFFHVRVDGRIADEGEVEFDQQTSEREER